MLPSQFTVEEGVGGGLLAIDVNRWIPAIVFVFVVVEHMCKLKKSLEDASVFHAWSCIRIPWWTWFGCDQKCPCGVQCL